MHPIIRVKRQTSPDLVMLRNKIFRYSKSWDKDKYIYIALLYRKTTMCHIFKSKFYATLYRIHI